MKTACCHRQRRHLFLNLTIIVFKIMGLAPFAIQNVNKVNNLTNYRKDHHRVSSKFVSSRLGGLYNLGLILGQFCLAFLSMRMEPDSQYPYKSNLTTIIEFVLSICGNGVVTVIWLIYCSKQNILTILMNRLTHVDVTLNRMKGTSVCKRRSDACKFISLFVTYTFLWILVLTTEDLAFHEPAIMRFSYIVPTIIVNWFTVQYVLAINFIKNRFTFINNVLQRCSMTSIVFPIRTFFTRLESIDDFRITKIATLRRVHTCLYEISTGVADFYSLPILLAIGFTSFSILYNTYYLFVPIVFGMEKWETWIVVNVTLWLITLTLPVMALVSGVNGVTMEMKKVADVIPDLIARPTTSYQDKTELGKFAFELLHKDVEYTGYRFFPLDGTLLQSVFGMVSTYLTIIFQLQLGSSRSRVPSSSIAYDSTNSSTKTI